MINNHNQCLSFCSDSEEEEEPVMKSKKSSKEKAASSKAAAPPKKDPVQYVSETGETRSECWSLLTAFLSVPTDAFSPLKRSSVRLLNLQTRIVTTFGVWRKPPSPNRMALIKSQKETVVVQKPKSEGSLLQSPLPIRRRLGSRAPKGLQPLN